MIKMIRSELNVETKKWEIREVNNLNSPKIEAEV